MSDGVNTVSFLYHSTLGLADKTEGLSYEQVILMSSFRLADCLELVMVGVTEPAENVTM